MQNFISIIFSLFLILQLDIFFNIEINSHIYLDIFYIEILIDYIKLCFNKKVNNCVLLAQTRLLFLFCSKVFFAILCKIVVNILDI